MSEVHIEEHDSPIKTPQQLIVVVVLSFLIPVIGIVMIASYATGGLKVDSKGSSASDAGAPKTGDKAAWKARIAAGKDALYNSALHGKNAMPAKGGLASAPDADVKAAVDYLVGLAK